MRHAKATLPKTLLGPVLRSYFCDFLISQRNLSPRTAEAYRDTFKRLLEFLERQYRIKPDAVCFEDLDASRIVAFLNDLEQRRSNLVRTRNARLAAVRSFARYVSRHNPLLLSVAQRILAIPMKRFERALVGHLTAEQIQAILDAPDPATFSGQRDRLLLMILYNTGARVSEVAALQVQDVSLESRRSVHLRGKGRKERLVPLWRQTIRLVKPWLQRVNVSPNSPLLPNARGSHLTRSGVAHRLRLAVKLASQQHSSLLSTRVSPHIIRHTTAMHLLQSGVELSVIAMWLGHESVQTTHQYLDADLEGKKRALAFVEPPRLRRAHLRPRDSVLQFLKDL
jgi:integrase/recombinase XerD